MSCQTTTNSNYVVSCARVCEKFNTAPIAEMFFDTFLLIDVSTYYDNGDDTNRLIKWEIYVGEYLVYDFGYGLYNDPISELANGSIYSVLNLGDENDDIISFLESLPSTIINSDVTLEVKLTVKDNSGVESENIAATYKFNKFQ